MAYLSVGIGTEGRQLHSYQLSVRLTQKKTRSRSCLSFKTRQGVFRFCSIVLWDLPDHHEFRFGRNWMMDKASGPEPAVLRSESNSSPTTKTHDVPIDMMCPNWTIKNHLHLFSCAVAGSVSTGSASKRRHRAAKARSCWGGSSEAPKRGEKRLTPPLRSSNKRLKMKWVL